MSQTCCLIQLWFSENRILKIKLNEPSVFTEGVREKESLAIIHITNVVESFVRLRVFTMLDIIFTVLGFVVVMPDPCCDGLCFTS